MANLMCMVVTLLFFQAASMLEVKMVEGDGDVVKDERGFKSHDIQVECPNNCVDNVSEGLNG